MAFSSKRGRPKVVSGKKSEIDLGTEELQKKRQRNLTAEPIDICRQKGIIDEDQHAAALHFRWLYTLKFGAAGVSAIDLSNVSGHEIRNFDEAWLQAREIDYSSLIQRLRAAKLLKIIMNTVIFNYPPQFLSRFSLANRKQIRLNNFELNQLRDGLTILCASRNQVLQSKRSI